MGRYKCNYALHAHVTANKEEGMGARTAAHHCSALERISVGRRTLADALLATIQSSKVGIFDDTNDEIDTDNQKCPKILCTKCTQIHRNEPRVKTDGGMN